MAKVSLSSCIRRCHQNKLPVIVCMEFLTENLSKAAGRASEPAGKASEPAGRASELAWRASEPGLGASWEGHGNRINGKKLPLPVSLVVNT